MPPRAAYIHVPFCRHRCGYCNFAVVADRDDLIDDYLSAVETELSWLDQPRPVSTLFIGGGTPTHLAPDQLERLLRIVNRWHPLDRAGEFSVEANPADILPDKIALLADAGVNRISLGVQSFHDAKLAILERDHRAADVARAVEIAKQRIPNVALDLIFAAPGETMSDWQADLHSALQLAPEHLSTYGLTWEKGTSYWSRLQREQLTAVGEEDELAMYLAAIDTLGAAGFEHYEVFNFARSGWRCCHNEAYWLGDEYYAAGPGAARYVDGRRESNHRGFWVYLKLVKAGKSPIVERELLDPEQRARELLVFAMRRLEGVSRVWFQSKTGFDLEQLAGGPLGHYVSIGLMEWHGENLRLTRQGLVVSDSLWGELLVGPT